ESFATSTQQLRRPWLMQQRPNPPHRSSLTRFAARCGAWLILMPVTKLMAAFGAWPREFCRAIERGLGAFGEHRPGPGDVVVCSYYKSGTNWALQIVTQIAYRGAAEFQHIHDLVPWPEMPPHIMPTASMADSSIHAASPTKYRVIKTHLPQNRVPYDELAKYVCVVRDPKDVYVSSFHFTRTVLLGPLMPSHKHWLDNFLSPDAMFGPWWNHLAGYWVIRD